METSTFYIHDLLTNVGILPLRYISPTNPTLVQCFGKRDYSGVKGRRGLEWLLLSFLPSFLSVLFFLSFLLSKAQVQVLHAAALVSLNCRCGEGWLRISGRMEPIIIFAAPSRTPTWLLTWRAKYTMPPTLSLLLSVPYIRFTVLTCMPHHITHLSHASQPHTV